MNNIKVALEKHSRIVKFLVLGYIVFSGIFTFPFGNEMFPFDFSKGYLIISSYGIIALGFAGIYGEHKAKFVFAGTLGLTVVGILLRFLLEYGEVSNTMNFTTINVVSYLMIIPVYVTVAYYLIVQYLLNHVEQEGERKL